MKKTSKRNFSTCSVQQRFALVTNAKKKPRGKPFAKGNTVGNRFRKGEPSANPLGRPKSKEFARAYREWAAGDITAEELKRHQLPLTLLGLSRAEVGAWIRGEKLLSGSLADAVELADRAEGRPAVTANANGGSDPMVSILKEMEAVRFSLYGQFKKTEETDDNNQKQDE